MEKAGAGNIHTCWETVSEAITAFLEGNSFEDVIRTTVSLGGNCDTLTCIAGSIAEGFYGVLEGLKRECQERLPTDLRDILFAFESSDMPKQKNFLQATYLIK